MHLTAGKVLQNGKYVLDTVIGQGGFGITYKANHTYLGQTVVIKTLQDKLRLQTNFEYFQKQFIAEAQRLARCQHPHIVRVLDFFEEAGQAFMVMDYIPGATLSDLCQQGQPLSESQAIHYIRQVGAALTVVHQNGLLHRDVKPQNIIRREGTENVILIDFGIAREFSLGITQTQTGIISAGYAPIEQYIPRHKRSPATDVYALAATLYCMVTGQPPVAAILRDKMSLINPRELEPDLSPALEHAILRGLAIDAENRPQTVIQWLDLLPQTIYTPTAPTLAPPTMHPQRFALPFGISQTPRWKTLGIAGAIAAIFGLGFGLSLRFGGSVPLIQREQSFPPTDNWPNTIPSPSPSPTSQESNSTPEPTPTRESRSQPQTTPAYTPTPAPRRRARRDRTYQPAQPVLSPEPRIRRKKTFSPTPEASIPPSQPTLFPAATPDSEYNPIPTPTVEISPAPTPVNPEPTVESSDPPPKIETPEPTSNEQPGI